MASRFLQILLFGLFGLLNQACLPSVENGESTGSAQSSGFVGASGAQALDANSIRITWDLPSLNQAIDAFQVFEVNSDSSLSPLILATKEISEYIHTGLAPESLHRYVVRGLYSDGAVDENFKIVSATTTSGASGGLALSPQSRTVSFNEIFNFSVSGGAAPYSYSVLSGPGSVNPLTGEFVSLSSAGVATVRVTDSSGQSAFASVTVTQGFTLSPATRQLKFGRTLQLLVQGATDPVSYTLVSGQSLGTLTSTGQLTAGTQTGTIVVSVTDATGLSKEAVVTVVDQMIPHDQMLIATSGSATCYTKTGFSKFICWGKSYFGILGKTEGITVGDEPSELGDNRPSIDIGPGTITDIQGGPYHQCALFSTGGLKCFGRANYGQLLKGSTAYLGDNPGELGSSLNFLNLGSGRTVKSFSTRSERLCAILDNDLLKCWGYNYYGALGIGGSIYWGDAGSEVGDNLPYVNLGTGHTVKKVAVGLTGHICAILNDNRVKCWGRGASGKRGSGTTTDIGGDPGAQMGDALPYVDLGTGRTAVDISLGGEHACAVLDNGSVKCWGNNTYGQLGLGNNLHKGDEPGEMGDALLAVDLGVGRTAVSVALGHWYSCALLDNQSVKCWGHHSYGGIGSGSTAYLGDHASEMGDNLPPVNLGSDSNGDPYLAAQIYTGPEQTCVRTTVGDLKCFGLSSRYQLPYGDNISRGDAVSELGNQLPVVDYGVGRKVSLVSLTGQTTCVVLDNGKFTCHGIQLDGRTGTMSDVVGDAPGELASSNPTDFSKPIKDISVGSSSACAVFDDGEVKCWGYGWGGALLNGSSTSLGDQKGEVGPGLISVNLGSGEKAKQIAVGVSSACVVLETGKVKCWGYSAYGVLGNGVASGYIGDSVAEVGDNLPYLDLGTNVTAQSIVVGYYFHCVLLTTGNVKCWGRNGSGQLGRGHTDSVGDGPGEMGDSLPVIDLGTGRTAKQIAAGSSHVCAILDNDEVKCWGAGGNGRTGHGDVNNRGDNPGEMGDALLTLDLGTEPFKPVQILAANNHSCVLFSNEKVKCWGYGLPAGQGSGTNFGDQPGEMGNQLSYIDLGTDRRVIRLSKSQSTDYHICAVLDDASVKCWGENAYGELGIGHQLNIGDASTEMGEGLPALSLPF